METNDTDEQTVTEISKLIERKKAAAYEEGYRIGRADVINELKAAFNHWLDEKPQPRVKRETMTASSAIQIESIEDAVREGLVVLAAELPNGVEPQALAEFFKDAPLPIDVKQVRAALRQLTMRGETHRVADGRYLPGPADAAAPIAETAVEAG